MPVSTRQRFDVFKRDHFRCVYCGRTPRHHGVELHVDHVHPLALGGTDDPDNLVAACSECNLGKSDRPLHEQQPAPTISLLGQHTCQEWFADRTEARQYGHPSPLPDGECGQPAVYAIHVTGLGGHWSCERCARFYATNLVYRLDSIPLPPATLTPR